MPKDNKNKKKPVMAKKKKPTFNVMNFGFMKSVKARWRKPRGTHNKKRMGRQFTGASPKIGYKNPSEIRGKRRNGETEVLVHNAKQLDGIKGCLVRVGKAVGQKKRMEIQEKAKTLGLKVINVLGAKSAAGKAAFHPANANKR